MAYRELAANRYNAGTPITDLAVTSGHCSNLDPPYPSQATTGFDGYWAEIRAFTRGKPAQGDIYHRVEDMVDGSLGAPFMQPSTRQVFCEGRAYSSAEMDDLLTNFKSIKKNDANSFTYLFEPFFHSLDDVTKVAIGDLASEQTLFSLSDHACKGYDLKISVAAPQVQPVSTPPSGFPALCTAPYEIDPDCNAVVSICANRVSPSADSALYWIGLWPAGSCDSVPVFKTLDHALVTNGLRPVYDVCIIDLASLIATNLTGQRQDILDAFTSELLP